MSLETEEGAGAGPEIDTTEPDTDPTKDPAYERLERKVEDATVEGWEVDQWQGDRVVMTKHRYGKLGAHILIALLTLWWTLGVGNALYAAYVYFRKPDRRVLRAE